MEKKGLAWWWIVIIIVAVLFIIGILIVAGIFLLYFGGKYSPSSNNCAENAVVCRNDCQAGARTTSGFDYTGCTGNCEDEYQECLGI